MAIFTLIRDEPKKEAAQESAFMIYIALSIMAIRRLSLTGMGGFSPMIYPYPTTIRKKTSYEVAVAVDPKLSGHGLGALLSTYGAMLGWERGSRVRKSSVHPLNVPSGKNLLNYAGFYPELSGSNVS